MTGSIDEFRAAKDHFFAHHPEAPLPDEEREAFNGLAYYPPSDDLVIDAHLEPPENTDDLTMQTSTGDEVTYHRAGRVNFSVDGQPAALTLFQTGDGEEYFVPFRDRTSGSETYGAGRYLEVPPAQGDHVTLDFNYAYNPYCAYSEAYSCPLPPGENWLQVPIRAGEKIYQHQAAHQHD